MKTFTASIATRLMLLGLASPGLSHAARRALVIGNLDYADAGRFPDLATSVSDARKMAELLGKAGFLLQQFNYTGGKQLPYAANLTRRAMEDALMAFADSVAAGDDAVVYYAGHGIQYENKVYLMGTDAEFRLKANFDKESVSQEVFSATLAAKKPRVTVLILDCCREQPDQTWLASENKSRGVRGTERPSLNLPPNILVGYATSSGRKANDTLSGKETNGPLVAALAKHWGEGLEWDPLWKTVSKDVFTASTNAGSAGYNVEMQMPSKYGQTVEDFYFTTTTQPRTAAVTPAPSVPPQPRMVTPATATKDAPYVNSLGMEFVPVAATPGLLWCRWETRVQDYETFCKATGRTAEKPDFPQTGLHPVVNVSLEDARAFVKWLSAKDGLSYRLPTDHEWSGAVGIGKLEAASDTPESKDGQIKNRYPWGTSWPPPPNTGNFDGSLKVDTYEETAPVGSFPGNGEGLYDLGGNVWEWCDTPYNKKDESRVVRGGSWIDDDSLSLLSSCRLYSPPALRIVNHGFRVVLVVGGGG